MQWPCACSQRSDKRPRDDCPRCHGRGLAPLTAADLPDELTWLVVHAATLARRGLLYFPGGWGSQPASWAAAIERVWSEMAELQSAKE